MWEAIVANRRRSAVLIVGMAVILLIIGYAGGEVLARKGGVFGLLLAIAIFVVMMIVYFTSAESILMSGTPARELKREDSPQLFNIVDEMRLASGLGFMPRIYLIDDPAPNAFAIGRKPETSAIAVTTGLMYRLNRDELQGVIGHEIGHLKNHDTQFMTLAAVMLGSIVILSEIVRRSLWYGGRGRDRSDSRNGDSNGQAQLIIFVVGLIFVILGPIMAQLLYFACSRKREYLADASSVQFTRYPEGLASALEKISQAHVPLSFASQATAPMFIINPLSAASGEPDSVFSSHPPTSQRIRILRAMTGAAYADYEAAYRTAKGGSIIGARTLQSTPQEPIRAPSADESIHTRQEAHDVARRSAGYMRLHCNCGLDISVPEGYEQDSIRCFRCGSVLPIPAAVVTGRLEGEAPAEPLRSGPSLPPVIPSAPLQFHRTGTAWQSVRCACGRTIQLSPAFDAPQIRCTACGQTITVT